MKDKYKQSSRQVAETFTNMLIVIPTSLCVIFYANAKGYICPNAELAWEAGQNSDFKTEGLSSGYTILSILQVIIGVFSFLILTCPFISIPILMRIYKEKP